MVTTYKTITVTGESDLLGVLEAAASEPVILEKDGVRFRVVRMDVDRAEEPEARRTFRERAGIITPEEAEQLKDLVYRARQEGTRPPDSP